MGPKSWYIPQDFSFDALEILRWCRTCQPPSYASACWYNVTQVRCGYCSCTCPSYLPTANKTSYFSPQSVQFGFSVAFLYALSFDTGEGNSVRGLSEKRS